MCRPPGFGIAGQRRQALAIASLHSVFSSPHSSPERSAPFVSRDGHRAHDGGGGRQCRARRGRSGPPGGRARGCAGSDERRGGGRRRGSVHRSRSLAPALLFSSLRSSFGGLGISSHHPSLTARCGTVSVYQIFSLKIPRSFLSIALFGFSHLTPRI